MVHYVLNRSVHHTLLLATNLTPIPSAVPSNVTIQPVTVPLIIGVVVAFVIVFLLIILGGFIIVLVCMKRRDTSKFGETGVRDENWEGWECRRL